MSTCISLEGGAYLELSPNGYLDYYLGSDLLCESEEEFLYLAQQGLEMSDGHERIEDFSFKFRS